MKRTAFVVALALCIGIVAPQWMDRAFNSTGVYAQQDPARITVLEFPGFSGQPFASVCERLRTVPG